MIIEIASKKDIYVVGIDGEYSVGRITDKSILGKRFYGIMYAVRKACGMLKVRDLGSDVVVFKTTNSTFVGWMQNEYSNKSCERYFAEMLDELNSIPMRYSFEYRSVLNATRHLDSAKIPKVSVEGVGDLIC